MRRHPQDVAVTVPASAWGSWLDEGALPGDLDAGVEYFFWIGNRKPNIESGMRVYIVAGGKLRGYAPLSRIHFDAASGRYALVRRGRAVAVTLQCCPIERHRALTTCSTNGGPTILPIKGFQGFRYRWWYRHQEKPFQDWREL